MYLTVSNSFSFKRLGTVLASTFMYRRGFLPSHNFAPSYFPSLQLGCSMENTDQSPVQSMNQSPSDNRAASQHEDMVIIVFYDVKRVLTTKPTTQTSEQDILPAATNNRMLNDPDTNSGTTDQNIDNSQTPPASVTNTPPNQPNNVEPAVPEQSAQDSATLRTQPPLYSRRLMV